MGNGGMTVLREIVKAVTHRDRPSKESWVKFHIDESKRIVGLERNYIWTFKHDDNDSDYDTFNGFVISAHNFEDAWMQMHAAAKFDESYDFKTPWLVQIIGIDLTGEGDRVIESSFMKG